MLRIYSVALEMCRDAAKVAKQIERHDRNLAEQLRSAASSVPLNIAEGSGAFGGHRKQRDQSALRSTYQVRGCYDTAQSMGYIQPLEETAPARQGHVTA